MQSQQPSQRKLIAPQAPVPPEIEGYLKKLKRKTSSLSGSWNKRWFFVDPRRREFGYAANKAPNAPRSKLRVICFPIYPTTLTVQIIVTGSIFLDDITAVVQFDETHFQVESRTRNFFLCGESKASTCCWVSTLDEYRKKLAAYEKEKTTYLAACKLLERESEHEVALAAAAAKSLSISAPVKKEKSEEPAARSSQERERERTRAKKADRKPAKEEPRRDSSSSSLESRSSSSASSSTGRSSNDRSRISKPSERRDKSRREARRSPSPTSTPEPSPPPPSRSAYARNERPPRVPSDRGAHKGRGGYERGVERDCSRDNRGRGRGKETWRDDCDDDEVEEDVAAGESIVEITTSRSRGRGGRADEQSGNPSQNASRGRVVQAWIDEDFD